MSIKDMSETDSKKNNTNKNAVSPTSESYSHAVVPVYRKWFTDGATMTHPTWRYWQGWLAGFVVYILLNMFNMRILAGYYFTLDSPFHYGRLIPQLLSPLSIFNYPSYILVVAMIATLLCVLPVLVALLYNFAFSVPFLIVLFFIGHNSVLSLCLLLSCAAVSFEPLRFKSKFVATVVCLVPALLYWVLNSGNNPEQDILRWAVLYLPWGLAFLFSVGFVGIVIALGHFSRYRPEILPAGSALLLIVLISSFYYSIGMDERDYQAQVGRFHPDNMAVFQARSIQDDLDRELKRRIKQNPQLNKEILLAELRWEWQKSFDADSASNIDPASLARQEQNQFERTRIFAITYMENFIERHPENERVPDALYYVAMIKDMKVDIRALRDDNVLRCYYDIPSAYSESIWKNILDEYPNSRVSVQARWRLAWMIAARQPECITDLYQFDKSLALLHDALALCDKFLQHPEPSGKAENSWAKGNLATVFSRPQPAITPARMQQLQQRINNLIILLSLENRQGHIKHEQRLAKFVSLDPHRLDYEDELNKLNRDVPLPDPLQDNIELAQINLVRDNKEKILRLRELADHFAQRDGGIQALLQLSELMLEVPDDTIIGVRHEKIKSMLNDLIKTHPESFRAQRAQKLLQQLNARDTQ